MSDAKKCDRCGAYYEKETGSIVTHNGWISHAKIYGFDFCPKCDRKFVRWMNKHQQVIEVIKDE